MMKAGLIDEMMGDAMDSALDTEDMEEETEAQVEAILAEVAGETLASLPAARVRVEDIYIVLVCSFTCVC